MVNTLLFLKKLFFSRRRAKMVLKNTALEIGKHVETVENLLQDGKAVLDEFNAVSLSNYQESDTMTVTHVEHKLLDQVIDLVGNKSEKRDEQPMEIRMDEIRTQNNQKKVTKDLPATSSIDNFMDLLSLFNTFEKELQSATDGERRKYFFFFVSGVILTYVGVFFTLRQFGIVLTLSQWGSMIGSFSISVGFAFVWGKFKEYFYIAVNKDPEKWHKLLKKAVSKLDE